VPDRPHGKEEEDPDLDDGGGLWGAEGGHHAAWRARGGEECGQFLGALHGCSVEVTLAAVDEEVRRFNEHRRTEAAEGGYGVTETGPGEWQERESVASGGLMWSTARGQLNSLPPDTPNRAASALWATLLERRVHTTHCLQRLVRAATASACATASKSASPLSSSSSFASSSDHTAHRLAEYARQEEDDQVIASGYLAHAVCDIRGGEDVGPFIGTIPALGEQE
jgi:hypothetical protein